MLERVLNLLQGGILQPLSFTTSGIGARITTLIDILLVATLLTIIFRFLRRTRATNILWGFLIVGLGIVVARLFNLATMNLVLSVFFALLVFAVPFLFQPELRRGLERLGRRGPFWKTTYSGLSDQDIRAIVEAVESMQNRKHGALIVLEQNTGLSDLIDTGVAINSVITAELLETIFMPGSPLHDGAVIIRDGFIAAAGCTLPLAAEVSPSRLGTRHRAALGVSENGDSISIVVSEERGAISIATDGRLVKIPSAHDLEHALKKLKG